VALLAGLALAWLAGTRGEIWTYNVEPSHLLPRAGRCWSTKSVVLVPEKDSKVPLPCLHNEDTKPHDPRSIADIYAKATFVSTDWVLKMKPRSRSFLGIPVVVKGAPWGVIIVDSRDVAIREAQQIIAFYSAIARPFIKCLERLP